MSDYQSLPRERSQPVIQSRCVSCAARHDGERVMAISYGTAACAFCGHTPKIFWNIEDYRQQMRTTRNRALERRQRPLL